METILDQARNLGTLVSSREELEEAGFRKGKKVLAIISSSCFYCGALMDDWDQDDIRIRRYLSNKNIGLLFLEKWSSLELSKELGDGSYPNVHCYKDGKQISGKFVELYSEPFLGWLEEHF